MEVLCRFLLHINHVSCSLVTLSCCTSLPSPSACPVPLLLITRAAAVQSYATRCLSLLPEKPHHTHTLSLQNIPDTLLVRDDSDSYSDVHPGLGLVCFRLCSHVLHLPSDCLNEDFNNSYRFSQASERGAYRIANLQVFQLSFTSI